MKALLSSEDNEGCTPLHYACRLGIHDSVKNMLGLSGQDGLTCKSKDKKSALHFAAQWVQEVPEDTTFNAIKLDNTNLSCYSYLLSFFFLQEGRVYVWFFLCCLNATVCQKSCNDHWFFTVLPFLFFLEQLFHLHVHLHRQLKIRFRHWFSSYSITSVAYWSMILQE